MENLTQITPYLCFNDVDAAVRFFVEVLGFKSWVHGPDYAYVQRESAAIRIGMASPDTPEEMHTVGERAFLAYIDVRDVDAVVADIRPKLMAGGMNDGLAGGLGPKDQSWGQREFWVPVPEGGLIIFGQQIAAKVDLP
jgi:catechol 2,3-dioxygenase-like lactoylglutathione lyase family enzyme